MWTVTPVTRTPCASASLTAAARLFRQQGYHGTALHDILTAGGSPRGSLYFHFPKGKEQIGAAALTLAPARQITAERLDLEDRARVAFGLGDVDERHLVVQPERGVPEAVRPGAVELGVDGADEFGVGVGLIGLGPVADDALRHGYLPIVVRQWF